MDTLLSNQRQHVNGKYASSGVLIAPSILPGVLVCLSVNGSLAKNQPKKMKREMVCNHHLQGH